MIQTPFSSSAWLLAALAALTATPLAAQDDHFSLLQSEPLTFTAGQLTANDGWYTGELEIVAEPEHGTLSRDGSTFTYRGDATFSGVDRFTYAWADTFGKRVEADVHLFVVPWMLPFAGLLPETKNAPQGVGYYNSSSRLFYFCPELASWPATLDCESFAYAGAGRGWLPLVGTWREESGVVHERRPALYDPSRARLYLLRRPIASCDGCAEPRSLEVAEERSFPGQEGKALVPVAADLDGDGADEVIFFDLVARRFLGVPSTPTLEDPMLWPLAAPAVAQDEDLVDELVVFSPSSGRYEVLTAPEHGVRDLWAGVSSLAVAHGLAGQTAFQVYDAFAHALSPTAIDFIMIDGECVPSGTQVLQFPSDPEPPPSGGGRSDGACPEPL